MSEEKKEKKEKKKKGESKVNVERIYTIPLRSRAPKWRRSEKAIFIVRAYLAKHLKAAPSDVHIDRSINEKIFAQGAKNPPKKIRVRAMKFDDGVVEAELKE